MYYIKIDENRQPVNHPMLGDNLRQVLEVSALDQATLDKYGYAKFEFSTRPVNAHVENSSTYFMDVDGVVRNIYNVREFTQEELVDKFIRARRSYLLVECDWTQTIDAPLSDAKKAEWAAYRQALRDLPTQYPDVQQESDVVWPTKPSSD